MKTIALKLPKKVLCAAGMRAEPKVCYGILATAADADGIVETNTLELAAAAHSTQRSIEKSLERLKAEKLIGRVHKEAGWLMLKLAAITNGTTMIRVPASVLAWPKLSAESQLAFAYLWKRRHGDDVQRVFHKELSAELGAESPHAGLRWLNQLIRRGLLTLLDRKGTPVGYSDVRVNDPDAVRGAYLADLKARYRRKKIKNGAQD